MNTALMWRMLALSSLLVLTLALATTYAQQPDGRANHAAVVVQYASGQVAARCVGFDEESISGYDALVRAGFGVVAEGAGGMGAMVCAIDGVGCDYPNEACGCKCQGAECTYWAYTHLNDGVWNYSTTGASSYRVRDGAVEGWAWGSGSVERGASPPVIGWGDVCAAQAAQLPTALPPTTVPPTRIPATAVPPTLAPTRVPPVLPTRVPPTQPVVQPVPSSTPVDVPTLLPTASPTAPLTATPPPTVEASSPTATPEPSANIPTAIPTPFSTDPSSVVVIDDQAQSNRRATNWLNYLAFGAIALALGAGILIMQQRRKP